MHVSFLINKLKAEKLIEDVEGKIYLSIEGKSKIDKFMKTQNCFY